MKLNWNFQRGLGGGGGGDRKIPSIGEVWINYFWSYIFVIFMHS